MIRGSRHFSSTLSVLLVLGCANAPLEGDPPEPLDCDGQYQVGTDGECGIPTIGPGQIETPDAPFEEPTLDNSDLDEQRGYFLNQEGDGKFVVYTGSTLRIGVRVVNNTGQPAPGRTVVFAPTPVRQGAPLASTLSAQRSQTNEFGVAHVEVLGGPVPEMFFIYMSGEDTTGLQYQVNVVQLPEGRDPDPPGPGGPGDPPPLGGECLGTQGTYQVVSLYEPARFLGDGVFGALDTIHRVLSNPGEAAGDWIQDRIDGIWGAVIRSAVEPVVNYLYNYIVRNYAPDWVRWMLVLTEDISSVLVELEIQGTMELGPAGGPECTLEGRHRWEQLAFYWRAGCPPGDAQCGRYVVDLAQMGVALSESDFDARLTRSIGPVADMEIGEHRLQLNLGVAVVWFVQNVILPQRLNVNDFGELLELVLPCDAVGVLVADYVGGSIVGFAVAPFVERACQAGLEALGNWLMRQLADQLRVDSFPMSGQCRLRDQNGDRLADAIEQGRWNAGLQGDFTGQRR